MSVDFGTNALTSLAFHSLIRNFALNMDEMTDNRKFRAALFDLDGVVLDTEGQYTKFWGQMGREFVPEVADFAQRIKGQTLRQIYDRWIQDPRVQAEVTRRLDEFEAEMDYTYIRGTRAHVEALRRQGILTAIVTSSNRAKMASVERAKPELAQLFDRIFTAEDFTESKPSPQCYLRAAEVLGVPIEECVVYEDSLNGLRSGRASGAYVVGLATTNAREDIEDLCDVVVDSLDSLGKE